MSPFQTLQGIYGQLVWNEEQKVSRRAMHEAVFEAGWKHKELMEQHRRVLSSVHRGKGREIIARLLDVLLSSWSVKKSSQLKKHMTM